MGRRAMSRTVGVLVMEHIAAGLVEGNQVTGQLKLFPESPQSLDPLQSMHSEDVVGAIRELVEKVAGAHKSEAAGVPVSVFNDAAAMAAGIAETHGKLHPLTRVWTLGNGIGFGRYPASEGVWEGGHTVVTLDPKESFCGCGGKGHLEGILGRRSMRMRFLDLEPEEVFENARAGDARCAEFLQLCHRALAAATADSIHMEGPGVFFITGLDTHFIDTGLLDRLVHEMVKMSPLQGSRFEVLAASDELGILGAAVNASHATK